MQLLDPTSMLKVAVCLYGDCEARSLQWKFSWEKIFVGDMLVAFGY